TDDIIVLDRRVLVVVGVDGNVVKAVDNDAVAVVVIRGGLDAESFFKVNSMLL
ncbi:unnamed protein product, partial [Rotaria magnacalcarata]